MLTGLPALVLILGLGIGAQWVAWRVRIPSILLLLGLGIVLVALYPRLGQGGSAGKAGTAWRDERQKLVSTIAELDDSLERGEIDAEAHSRNRARLFDRTIAISRALAELKEGA